DRPRRRPTMSPTVFSEGLQSKPLWLFSSEILRNPCKWEPDDAENIVPDGVGTPSLRRTRGDGVRGGETVSVEDQGITPRRREGSPWDYTRISTIRTRSTTSIARRTPSRRAWSATGPIAGGRTRPRKSHARLWRRHASAARSGTKTTRSGTADRMTRQEIGRA